MKEYHCKIRIPYTYIKLVKSNDNVIWWNNGCSFIIRIWYDFVTKMLRYWLKEFSLFHWFILEKNIMIFMRFLCKNSIWRNIKISRAFTFSSNLKKRREEEWTEDIHLFYIIWYYFCNYFTTYRSNIFSSFWFLFCHLRMWFWDCW